MNGYKITLEDKGQDFLYFITDENGIVQSAEPRQNEVWKGASIPIEQQEVGDFCMIHHPPMIEYDYLKYKVVSIERHPQRRTIRCKKGDVIVIKRVNSEEKFIIDSDNNLIKPNGEKHIIITEQKYVKYIHIIVPIFTALYALIMFIIFR